MYKTLLVKLAQRGFKTIILLLLTFSIFACGGGDSDSEAPLVPDPEPIPDPIPDPEPIPDPAPEPIDGYIANPDLNETTNGMLNAVLTNRNPDCRTYVTDDNNGDYGARGITDRSNAAWFSVIWC
ncbi:hypothetical protein [Psychromonas sp. Urea-02u-13]|uniref:hypothetical protein n=1 Tax=Psychromonas sp. Urea-02u-13 TaxID=2058326 RepID=UPI0012FE9936|nr:hypothetical protein [Psychromonas sp. Urea-02u-13]